MSFTVECPYCGKPAKFTNGREVYPHKPEYHANLFYRCDDCDAHVGCHRKTCQPLGTLANAKLRVWRRRAHEAFDPIWHNGSKTRDQAYDWLSWRLNIPREKCHIGMFDLAQCMDVVDLCKDKAGPPVVASLFNEDTIPETDLGDTHGEEA